MLHFKLSKSWLISINVSLVWPLCHQTGVSKLELADLNKYKGKILFHVEISNSMQFVNFNNLLILRNIYIYITKFIHRRTNLEKCSTYAGAVNTI